MSACTCRPIYVQNQYVEYHTCDHCRTLYDQMAAVDPEAILGHYCGHFAGSEGWIYTTPFDCTRADHDH